MRFRTCCVVAACIAPWGSLAACGSRTGLFTLEPAPDAAATVLDSAMPEVDLPDVPFPPDEGPDADAMVDSSLPPIDATVSDAPPLCPDGGVSSAYLWSESGTLYTFDPTTLTTQSLGVVSCPTAASPWTLSVSREGYGYMLYEDWNIYRVNLATLACATTPYQPFQLGFIGEEAIAVSRGAGAERLFVYGLPDAGPTLAVTDLTSFVLTPVGEVTPNPNSYPLDMQGDAFGRLFALSPGGLLLQLDSATGALLAEDQTTYNEGGGGWAIMTYNEQIFFFGGTEGSIYSFDLASQTVTNVAQVNDIIVGASAADCIH